MDVVYVSFIFVAIFLLEESKSEVVIRNKNSTDSIEFYFCRNGLKSGMTIGLLPFIEYTITLNQFCMVQNVTNVTIKSTSADQASIVCNGTTGFAFFNVSNLHFENLKFVGCGGEIRLPLHIESITNKSNVYIGPYQQVVLLFTHCQNVVTTLVNITGEYKGIAMLFMNTYGTDGTSIRNVNVANKYTCQGNTVSSFDFSCAGGGIVFVYTDVLVPLDMHHVRLDISNSIFSKNSQLFSKDVNVLNFFSRSYLKTPILSAAGLTFIIASNTYAVHIKLDSIKIFETYNTHIGAMLVVLHRTVLSLHSIEMTSINITSNYLLPLYDGQTVAAGITFIVSAQTEDNVLTLTHNNSLHSKISISQANISSNYGNKGVGILFVAQPFSYVNVEFILSSCTFIQNNAADSGSAMYFEISQINYNDISSNYFSISLSQIIATRNRFWRSRFETDKRYHYGQAVTSFINVPKVNIKNCDILYNNGSAIEVYNSVLEFEGCFNCENNTSIYGGCLLLKGLSYILLMKTTNAKFINNTALVSGGAIYGDTLQISTDVCTIQPYKNASLYNYPLLFKNNHAQLDGDDIKITNIYDCSLLFNKTLQKRLLKIGFSFYKEIFHFDYNNSRSISGKESTITLCGNETDSIISYSGQKIVIPVLAKDTVHNPVSANLFITSNSYSTESFKLIGENYHSLYPGKCNNLNYTITSATMEMFSGRLRLQSTLDPKVYFNYHVEILPCPIGFYTSSVNDDRCICSPFLNRVAALKNDMNIVCNIGTVTIQLPVSSWFGASTKFNSSEAFSFNCPPDYCILNGGLSYDSTVTDPLCKYNRTGVMCGECQYGMSKLIGSYECRECSNLWLLTILIYVVIGLTIVLVLFYTKLTIASGLLEGPILFAHLSAVSLHIDLLDKHNYAMPIKVFMAAVNLNMGFPMCFYNGMNSISKTALQFAFPVYLWCIVFVLIVISRYSSKVTNLIVGSSVQVLVTLIHLSFTKLLVTVSDIFISEKLFVSSELSGPSQDVWYFDGSQLYFSGSHLILFCVAISVLILFIFPYLLFTTIIITFPIRRFCSINNHRLNPLIDAFTGQYKPRYKYWFSVRLCLVTVLYIVYVSLRGYHPRIMLIINIMTIFLLVSVQVYIKPFKNKNINLIDSVFIYLLCVTDIVTYFFIEDNNTGSTQSSIAITLLLTIYSFIVIGILVCSFFAANRLIKRQIMKIYNFIKRKIRKNEPISFEDEDYDIDHQRRMYEPVLEPINSVTRLLQM